MRQNIIQNYKKIWRKINKNRKRTLIMKKLKKTLSGITALCIIAGTISATAVSGIVDFKATDIKSLSELLLNIKKADKSQTEMYDINNDSTLNIVDMIRLKNAVINQSATTSTSSEVQKLNNYAKIIFENAELVADKYISNGIKLNHSFTNNSDDDFIVSLTECIGDDIPVEIKYSVVMSEGEVSGILCTDNGSRCGAYPNNIPQNMNIPFEENRFVHETTDILFDWSYFTEYKADDEKQATLPDYPELSVNELNAWAADIFKAAEKTTGKFNNTDILDFYEISLTDDNFNHSSGITDDGQIIPSFERTLIDNIKYLPKNITFKLFIQEGKPLSVVCSDNGHKSGAYPNNIPQNMNIPYNDDTNSYKYEASHLFFDWTKLTEYKSTDTAQANLPDYPELQVNELNLWASEMFKTADQTIEKFIADGRTLEPVYEFSLSDDSNWKSIWFDSDDTIRKSFESTLIEDSKYLPKNVTFRINIIDNKLLSVICSDTGLKSGAYPNAIPQNMNIPFEENLFTHEAADILFDWSYFTEYKSDDEKQSALPDYPELSVNELNSWASDVYKAAEHSIEEFINNGGTPEPVYEFSLSDKDSWNSLHPSTDDTSEKPFISILIEEIKHLPKNVTFKISTENNKILSVICSDTGLKSGAYPNSIPQNMNIPFDKEHPFTHEAADILFDWSQLKEYKATGDKQAFLPDYPELTVSELNVCADKIYKAVQQTIEEFTNAKRNVMPFYEFALTGDKKFDSFIEINDKDEILYSFEETLLRKIDYIPKNTSYMILIEENKVASVICTDNTFKSGAYPNSIPDDMEIEYSENTLREASFPDFKW